MLQSLLISQFDPAEIEYTILHGGKHPLTLTGSFSVEECSANAQREIQSGS